MNRFQLPGPALDSHFFSEGCLFRTFDPPACHFYSFAGKEVWSRPLPGRELTARHMSHAGLRAAGTQDVWFANGSCLVSVTNEAQVPVEAPVEAFFLLEEGFLVSVNVGESPIVVRLSADGRVVWRTAIAVESFSGAEPTDPLAFKLPTPRRGRQRWRCYFTQDPIVVHGSRAVVGFSQESGIGRYFCLDLGSGRVLWATSFGPKTRVTPAREEGAFFIGSQGYGAFHLDLVSPEGILADHWPVDGFVHLFESGRIAVVEMENVLPSKMHVSELIPGGVVRRGPWLDGYYTSRPTVCPNGELVFYRNQAVLSVSTQGNWELRTLVSDPTFSDSGVLSSMYRRNDGLLAVTVDSELVVLRP